MRKKTSPSMIDWYEEDDSHSLHPPDIGIDAPLVTEAEKTSSSFMDDYAKSFAPVIKILDMLFARSMWSGNHVATHPGVQIRDRRCLTSLACNKP